MNILLISYEFPPLGGGGGKIVEGLIRQLLSRGHVVDLITMRWSKGRSNAHVPGLTIHSVPCVRLRPDSCSALELAIYLPSAIWSTYRLVRRKKFDAYHAHFILPDAIVFYLLRRAGIGRFLITAHGSDIPDYNPDRFKHLHRLLGPLWRRVARAASTVVCPSPTLERLLKKHLPEARTEIVPNGIDADRIRPTAVRHRRILVVSRLQPRKGVQHVIEAFAGIDTEFELHIVGDGPMLARLRAQAQDDSRVVLHGWIDGADPQLIELIETASIFVLLSQAENFPVSLLEAMAAGLAIVTSDGTGCADVVGEAALLVQPGDVAGLRQALLRLIEDPRLVESIGKAGRQRLLDNFTWDEVAARYVRIYERLGATAVPRQAAVGFDQKPV